jgi:hypothetical protein
MKVYITVENSNKVKRSFINLKLFSIIDVSEILEKNGYTHSTIDDIGAFIINKYINDAIINQTKSKRIRGIIYVNNNLSKNSIDNIFDLLENNENVSDIVLMDDYNIPKLNNFYKYFSEIIFFPSIRKMRLIECKNILNCPN